MSADDLLHAITYGTDPACRDARRMVALERELAGLKAEGAPVNDPRVKAALSEYARLLTARRAVRISVSIASQKL